MNRKKLLLLNSCTSLFQQVISVVCGLVVPRLIIATFGSAANGTIASIMQFIGITSLIQGGVTGATRVAFYEPISIGDIKKVSVIYKTSQSFFRRFALVILGYVAGLAFLYPFFVSTPFSYIDALLIVLILGTNAICENLFGIQNQLLLFADQKAYINTILQTVCTLGNALITVVLIRLGYSLIVVKLVSTVIFVIKPLFLYVYVHKHYKLNYSEKKDKSVLAQSNAAFSKSIAFYVHTNTDNLVITACLSVMWVSVYAVHRYVVGSISSLVAAILGNTESLLGQMIAKNEKEALATNVTVIDLMSKMLSTDFFFTCIILITPFVKVYTAEVTDIDYYQPIFAITLCLAEYVYCTSLTYNNMIMAAGHIKQTRWISIAEAVINIILSLILVKLLGIIGVAIGTLVAFIFNTIANYIYMKKYIFNMPLMWVLKSYFLNFSAGVISLIIFKRLVDIYINSYTTFFICSVVVFVCVCVIDTLINYLFMKKETQYIIKKFLGRIVKK